MSWSCSMLLSLLCLSGTSSHSLTATCVPQVTALEQQLQAARLQQPGSGAAVDAVRQQAAQTPAGTSCPGSAVGEPAAVPASRAARQPESIDRSGTATANSSSSSLEASATVPAAGPVANPEGRVPPRKGAADNSGGHSSAAAVADLLQVCCAQLQDKNVGLPQQTARMLVSCQHAVPPVGQILSLLK